MLLRIPAIAATLLAAFAFPAAAAAQGAAPAPLKVCADPYMLPFSSKDEIGFENRIAELFAGELGTEIVYEWFPQRIGFIRNTLRSQNTDGSFKCDLVISVPEHFELTATTDPYYTSTYVLVMAKGRGLDDVVSPEQLAQAVERGARLRIGLADQGPAQLWVFRQGLMDHMIPYLGQPADPHESPGERLMRDIAADKIDAAIVWGPSAGYFARQLRDQAEFILLNLRDDPKYPDMRFEFSMAMGVRHGDDERQRQVNELIHKHQAEIDAILRDFGVPLLPLKKTPRRGDDD